MKLADLLARELESWPDDVKVLTQSCVDNELYCEDMGRQTMLKPRIKLSQHHDEHDYPQVSRSQWQSARDKLKGETKVTKPKANKDGWIRHRGGKCPVYGDVRIDYRMRDGSIMTRWAESLEWSHFDECGDIMAYRIHAPEQAVKSVEQRIIEAEQSAIAAQANHEYGDAKDSNDPRAIRDRIREIDSTVEALEEERESLIQRLADEGFKLMRVDGKVMPKQPELDMDDWRNWEVGDIVTFTAETCSDFTKGKEYMLRHLDNLEHGEVNILADDSGDKNGWSINYFKWHSRPSK